MQIDVRQDTDTSSPAAADRALSSVLPVAASLVVHALVLAAVVLGVFAGESGGGGVVLEAISVEVVDAGAVDARDRPEARAAEAASAASVADSEGAPADAAASPPPAEKVVRAEPDRQPETPPEEHRPPPRTEPEPEEAPAMEVTAAEPSVTPPEPERKFVETPLDQPLEESKERVEPRPMVSASAASAAAAGGAAARAAEAQEQTPARAGASPGEVNRYNAAVSRSLQTAMRKLAQSGKRGTARIQFVLDADGEVVDVRIADASGDPALDALIVKLIRATAFPGPPARMTSAQRTYAVPIRVK